MAMKLGGLGPGGLGVGEGPKKACGSVAFGAEHYERRDEIKCRGALNDTLVSARGFRERCRSGLHRRTCRGDYSHETLPRGASRATRTSTVAHTFVVTRRCLGTRRSRCCSVEVRPCPRQSVLPR